MWHKMVKIPYGNYHISLTNVRGHYDKNWTMFLFLCSKLFQKGDTIQGGTLFKEIRYIVFILLLGATWGFLHLKPPCGHARQNYECMYYKETLNNLIAVFKFQLQNCALIFWKMWRRTNFPTYDGRFNRKKPEVLGL